MINYYATLQSKTQAFLLEQRMKQLGIKCELSFVPREIMKDLCSMGVKFDEDVYNTAIPVIKSCGLPGIKIYKEIVSSDGCSYSQIKI